MSFDIVDDAEQPPLPLPELVEEPKKKRHLSPGEKLFDRVTYTGIGFGVNEASSLWITDQFKNGKNLLAKAPEPLKKAGEWFSKEGYERAGDWLGKTLKFAEKINKEGVLETQSLRGRNLLLMLTLLSGGTLLVWPMKKLEDHKNYWVKKANHWIDRMRGSSMSDDEVAARDAKVEQDIACSPRQSWPSFLVGRVAACCASVATGTFLIGPKNNKAIMDGAEKLLAGSVDADKSMWHRYASLIGVETYSCAISSMVLEFMSKFQAKRGTTVHDPKLCQAHAAKAETMTSGGGTDAESAVAPQTAAPTNYAEKIRSEQAAGSQMQAAV